MFPHQDHPTSPQDFFLTISAFGSLYCVLISLGVIVFTALDIIEQGNDSFLTETLVQGIAFFVVMLPTCIGLYAHLSRSFRSFPARRASRIRRWLIAFTLFMAGIIGVFAAISIVSSILLMNTTFYEFIKLLITGSMAAGIFLLFVHELRLLRSE